MCGQWQLGAGWQGPAGNQLLESAALESATNDPAHPQLTTTSTSNWLSLKGHLLTGGLTETHSYHLHTLAT